MTLVFAQKNLLATTGFPSTVEVLVSGYGEVAIQLAGTFTATVLFEATTDGSTYSALSVTPAAGGVAVTSATATGQWQGDCGGFSSVRARCSAFTSGVIIASIGAGVTAASGGTPGGSDTQIQFNDAGAFGGNAAFTYDVTNHAVKVNTDFYAAVTALSTSKYAARIGANDSDGYGAQIILESDSNDANNPGFITYSSLGTMAAPEVSGAGDYLFKRRHYGYDGDSFENTFFEHVTVSGAVTNGVVPGKVVYGVTKPDGNPATLTIDGNIPSAAFNMPVTASSFIGGALQADTTTAHTVLLQAYDVDGTAYVTFMTLLNGNTPQCTISQPAGATLAFIPPATDPHVVGALWNNAGTLTISAG